VSEKVYFFKATQLLFQNNQLLKETKRPSMMVAVHSPLLSTLREKVWFWSG